MAEFVLFLLIYVAAVHAAKGYFWIPPKAIRKLHFTKTCKSLPNGNALCDGVELEFDYVSAKKPDQTSGQAAIQIEAQ